MRKATVSRTTKETRIEATLDLDGTGKAEISTGIGFLDHMLDSLARHSLIDVALQAEGDLHIDAHHTTEDSGIVLGQALSRALGERKGIRRFGDALIPMDETLTRVALDASNRPYLIWKVAIPRDKLGTMDTELFKEWFQAFAQAGGLTLHVECLYGENSHHIVESCFKGLARALRQAIERAEATVASLGEESRTRVDEATGRARSAMDALVAELDGKIEAASERLAAMLEERDAAAATALTGKDAARDAAPRAAIDRVEMSSDHEYEDHGPKPSHAAVDPQWLSTISGTHRPTIRPVTISPRTLRRWSRTIDHTTPQAAPISSGGMTDTSMRSQ
mgnify:CR=1 FL=1